MQEMDDADVDEQIKDDIVRNLGYADGSRGKLIPFSYLGGKYKHLNWLLPLLPQTKSYVEPYGGSGVVLLNRDPVDVETFNDKYGEVVTFFRAVRDSPRELLQEITLTPYSEAEFDTAVTRTEEMSDVERARRFFMVVNGSYDNNLNSPNWSYDVKHSSRGVSKKISSYQAKLRRLMPIADRLTDVQIANKDAIDVIERFDSPKTLIYCDPPYPSTTREFPDAYVNDMTDADHREMAQILRDCDADVAVSSYHSSLYDELFVDHGWQRIDASETSLSASPSSGSGSTRTESLYVNYTITDTMYNRAFDDDTSRRQQKTQSQDPTTLSAYQ